MRRMIKMLLTFIKNGKIDQVKKWIQAGGGIFTQQILGAGMH